MSEMTTYRWTFEEDVLAYRTLGLEAIGVWRQKLDDYGVERGAELLREQGLTASSLSYAGGFTGADGHSFQDSLDDALDAVRIAGEIQAESLILVSGARAGHTTNHARRLLRDALNCLGDAAAEVGVQIALLPLQNSFGNHWTFLNSTDSALAVLQQCDHTHIGMALDLFQWGRDASLIGKLPQLAPWVKTVLVSDSPNTPQNDHDRCLPGEGVIPLGNLLTTLEGAGYSGWHEMQLISERLWQSDPLPLIERSASAFRALWPPRQPACPTNS